MRRLIIGMTGSTGAIFGVRMLEALKDSGIESHLIISKWAQRTLEHETSYTVEQVRALATVVHSQGDMGASISSGSFMTEGMVVIPCSVRTLAGIANGYGEHLVHRAADVILKERRKLVLVVRETPLSEVHLENMLKLARMGVVDVAADAGLLQPSADGRRHRQPHRRARARPVRHCRALRQALGRPHAHRDQDRDGDAERDPGGEKRDVRVQAIRRREGSRAFPHAFHMR